MTKNMFTPFNVGERLSQKTDVRYLVVIVRNTNLLRFPSTHVRCSVRFANHSPIKKSLIR